MFASTTSKSPERRAPVPDPFTELPCPARERPPRGHPVDRDELPEAAEGGRQTILGEAASRPSGSFQRSSTCGGSSKQTALLTTGAAADALPLEDLEASVGGHLHPAVRIEVRKLRALVLGELGGIDVAAALEHHHLASALGQPVGDDRPRGPGPDGTTTSALMRSESTSAGVRTEWGIGAVGELGGMPPPARSEEADVAGRLGRRVGVVADERELLGREQHRLDHAPQEPRQAPFRDVGEEATLDEVDPALRRHHGERRAQPEHGIDAEGGERQLGLLLLLGRERPQVLVDVGRHSSGVTSSSLPERGPRRAPSASMLVRSG